MRSYVEKKTLKIHKIFAPVQSRVGLVQMTSLFKQRDFQGVETPIFLGSATSVHPGGGCAILLVMSAVKLEKKAFRPKQKHPQEVLFGISRNLTESMNNDVHS